MAVVKNLNTDYIISTAGNSLSNITLTTNTVFVQGNLVVGGNSSAVTKTDLAITDNIITLNKGETGSGVTLGLAGISVDRGLSANVSIEWNEGIGKWTLTNDGSTFQAISTGSISSATTPQVYALVL